ncbi:MAG: HAD hydrolase-like protein [Erysipelotrichaceae bacterium]|nr:HAD hydrolase-like protein [Erysipelotrichaceae bacterium]
MKYVIFDFNGTIVDDVQLSLDCFNNVRKQFLNKGPIDVKEYREIFTFPVKAYYEAGGFDFEKMSFEEIGQVWMDDYISRRKECKVNEGIIDFFKRNREKGIKNVVLSASKIENLIEQIKELGIYDYLDEILGIDNIYASSKVPIGKEFIKDKNKEDCVMIGDTIHDAEVAKEMGIRCILVAIGHQSKEKLMSVCDEVYDSIEEVIL